MLSQSETARLLQVGIYDVPLKQLQPDLTIDLLTANIAVFGSKQSGKTTFVKNILVRLHEIMVPEILPEEIYILDLNGTMGDYEKLPFICCCMDDSNEEDVKTMFKTVDDALKQNKELLKQVKCNSIIQFLDDSFENIEKKPKHITLIVENMNAFLAEERFTLYHDMLVNFCRDGISKGLTVIFTANSVSGGVSRFMQSMETVVAFNISNDQAMDIFNEKPPQILHVAGRGIVKQKSDLYEFQSYLPFESDKLELAPFIQEITDKNKEYLPTRLISFTKSLTVDNFEENTYTHIPYERVKHDSDGIVIGLDYYRHEPVCIVPDESRCIGIYGKKSYGKTNLLNLLVCNMLMMEDENIGQVVMFDDGRKELEGLTEFIRKTYGTDVTVYYDRTDFQNYIRNLCNSFKKTEVTEKKTNSDTTVQQNNSPLSQSTRKGNVMGGFRMVNTLNKSRNLDSGQATSKVEDLSENQETYIVSEKKDILIIIQSKTMYQSSNNPSDFASGFLEDFLSILINNAEQYNLRFIFSDVKRHPTVDLDAMISSFFSKVFLLHDIAEFVDNNGSRTVFGEFEAKELKMEYAKCERGDGYYFDIERDVLTKMKFLECPFDIPVKKKN